MERERSAVDSFPDPIDLNQGSLPGNISMDHSAYWESMLNPVENRSSSYMFTPAGGNVDCKTGNDRVQSFNGWDCGESSASASNMQDRSTGDDSKIRMGFPVPFNSHPGSDVRPENWSLEPSNINPAGYVGGQVTGRFSSTHNCISNYGSPNVSSNHRFITEPILALNASSSNIGTSSGGFTLPEANDALGPSFGTWGSTCKRKALEGISGQFYPGGSSSSNHPKEKNIMPHPVPDHYSVPGTLSISGRLSLSPINHDRMNPSSRTSTSRTAPEPFLSSVPGIAESSGRNFSIRSDHRQHDSVPFDAPGAASMRNFGVYAAQTSTPLSNTNYSESRGPMNQNNTNHPYLTSVNEARGMHSHRWDGSCGSLDDSSSSSFMVSGAREEVNIRSSHRNSVEHLMAVSASETRSVLPEEIDWSFAPATFASSRNHSSGPRVGRSSGGRTSSVALSPYQSQASQNHQQLSEPALWIPISHAESESVTPRSPYAYLPSSSDGVASSSCSSQHQLPQNSAAFLMATPSDEINGWHAMTAVEGRHRLIHQVLNAMRRGAHIQSEDYRFSDPFINGFAELHDRHRDMRLDVDNMSYEELLALEERIGNVSTGLSEEKIRDSMKQRKYKSIGIALNLEPCCICQEDYVSGDHIGILECGHEFHTSCIKQWLTMKNLCPICKIAALKT